MKWKPAKADVPSKENIGIQVTPPRRTRDPDLSIATLSFLDNTDLMFVKGPKTPSPLPKTKVLEEADHLLAAAERELTSVDAKISSDRLLSAKTSSLHASELSSARRVMADVPLSPTKGSERSHSFNSRSKTSYRVPPNSLSSFKVHGNEENYKRKNGEKKNLNLHSEPKESKPSRNKSEEKQSEEGPRETSKSPAISEFSMFYEQQQLVEKKTQSFKEKNLATVIFKSDANIVSSTVLVKHDAETNTSPVSQNVQSNNMMFTRNSSIISMKTNKPEQEEDQPLMFSGKTLNVQKMPSVNIRPGFTIQHGPKINIVGSSTSSHKPKRKNTEFFDVVYPPSSPVFSESSFVSEQRRLNKQMDNHVEYICERHTFPSGRLIPGTTGENLRQSQLRNSLNLDEKKEVLLELIKSVTEKLEKQLFQRNKSCCRLVCSLPLLASVVRKIQVDCVKCVDLLNSHLDRLVVLMKEELRGNREISDDHCCQLDEAIHYQIVELELMQEENTTSQPAAAVTVIKHRGYESGADVRGPKKSVSFESIPDEVAHQADTETEKQTRKSNISQILNKKRVPASFGSKLSSWPQQPTTSKQVTQNLSANIVRKKITSTQQKQVIRDVKVTNNRGNGLNPILKKTKDAPLKEKTVVGQVLSNLSHKKSILKQDSVDKDPRSGNLDIKSNVLNSFVTIVDHKDSTSEFEKWIEQRSLKIQQIHDELNKMVAGSMESYLENNAVRNETEGTTARLKLLESSNREVNVEKHHLPQAEDREEISSCSHQEVIQNQEIKDDNVLDPSPPQDEVQEYDEDFEEDVEEQPNLYSVASYLQQSGAEAENDSSSSSGIQEVIIAEVTGTEDTSVTVHKSPINYVSNNLREKESPKQHVQIENKRTSTNLTLSDNNESTNENEAVPTKISIATSPINFQTTSQRTDASVNTSIQQVEIKKVTMATSPINLPESKCSNLASTMVQTVNLSDSETKSVTLNKINVGEVDLTVPSVRLTPTPIENIFQIALGETKENTVALHTDSSNRTLKLVVQLPGSEKNKINKNSNELDYSDESERETHSRDPKPVKNTKTKKNASTSLNYIQGDTYFHDTSNKGKIDEQTIKRIIEPTVSEVLRKMKEDNLSMNAPRQNEDGDNQISNPNTCQGLVKPTIILQTKHGLWKKCDENPVLSIIDLEQPNPKVDSSNQTDTERQNVSIQAVESEAASCCEKDTLSHQTRGYLEMLLPRPPPSFLGTVVSSLSHSSTCCTTSRSSSSTSTSSNGKYEKLDHLEKLSDGELLPESCDCKIGEVCEVCIPRLDLSFGELKTKKRGNRIEKDSSSDSNLRHTLLSLSNLPLHLEPKPASARVIPSSAPNLISKPNMNVRSAPTSTKTIETHVKTQVTHGHKEAAANSGLRPSMKQFSEVAQSVLNNLGKELSALGGISTSMYSFPKPPPSISTIDLPLTTNLDTSSSDSLKSLSHKGLRPRKNGNRKKSSLVIKKPMETPRIDVVIEDPELSTSSYQTSVTSVSIDQLPEVLTSHSSADASS